MSGESKVNVAGLGRTFLIVVVLWLVLLIMTLWFVTSIPSEKVLQYSLFGDTFAVISVLVSAFAFVALYMSIRLQQKQLKVQTDELKLQREELEQTRAELRGQKEQLEAQNLTLKQQSFEDKFFRMLTLLGDIVRDLKAHDHLGALNVGRESIRAWCTRLQMCWREELDKRNSNQSAFAGSDRQVIERACLRLNEYQLHQGGGCSHYFHTLYNILKFVKLSETADKQFYADLTTALLSTHELRLLFYICQTPAQYQKLKPLVEEFAVLERLEIHELFDPSHLDLFSKSAYGSRS